MTEVISIRFKDKGKTYYFDPGTLRIESGCQVIVETAKGLEIANCTEGNHEVPDNAVIAPLRPVVRVATPDDIRIAEENVKKEAEAFDICREKIATHGIDMHLIDVEYSFEGNKIIFFFTSDGRVDFRDLVKDLASVFKTRIELRQIGVRDEAKMTGGFGICGRPFCCKTFLSDFHPVSIKMAKVQGLSLNPVKISGTCGRLMCCLKYEEDAYEDLTKNAPKVDAFVETPGGKGSVMSVNLLRGYAKVKLEDTTDDAVKTYMFEDLEVLGGKGRKAEYLAAKEEGTLAEHGFRPSVIRAPMPIRTYSNDASESFMFADGSETEFEPAQTAAPVEAQPEKKQENKNRQEKKQPAESRPQNANAEQSHGKKKKHKSKKTGAEGAAQKQPAKVQEDKPAQNKSNQKGHHVQAKAHKPENAGNKPEGQKNAPKAEQKPAQNKNGNAKKPEQKPAQNAAASTQPNGEAKTGTKKKKPYKPYYHKKKSSGKPENKAQ